ncbi:MAG: type II secretion system F family protein [Candidatus Nealsonbacteria bacterium]|nr:type II secretion system F family protein [Candidatus Nealsonbacteria bacterium]
MSYLQTLIGNPTLVVFVVSAGVFFVVARLLIRKPSREATRLDGIRSDELDEEPASKGLFGALTPALAAQLPESHKEKKDFRLLLRQAGLYSPAARTTIYALRFVFLLVPLTVAGIWAVMADSDQTWQILFGGGVAAAVLSIAPRLYVYFRRRGRLQRIRQGLPDTIDMLSMCSSGGLGMSETLEHVAGQIDAYPELADELRILRRQAEMGSLKQALADFTVRVDTPEVRQLTGLLTRGTRLGTKLAGSLNDQADHLRVARRQAAITRANKMPVKLVLPILFCFAPAALILLTAPAMLELRDFLVPQKQATATGEGFGTGVIIDTLDTLNQRPDALVVGEATSDEWEASSD